MIALAFAIRDGGGGLTEHPKPNARNQR
jgi:hypothetical protein